MSGIVFTQDDIVEALSDLIRKRGLSVEGGHDINWHCDMTAPSGEQLMAVCVPWMQGKVNKKGRDG